MPEFSLHRNRILSLCSTSSSMSASMRIAMDLDFPAPTKPWMHRSSRLVRRAMVTAQSAQYAPVHFSCVKKGSVPDPFACFSCNMAWGEDLF